MKSNSQTTKKMKLLNFILVTAAVAFSSCASTNQAGSGRPNDDVYYSSSNNNSVSQPAPTQTQAQPQRTVPSEYTPAQSQERTSDANADNSNSRFDYGDNGTTPSSTSSRTDDQGNTYVTNNYYNDDDYYDYAYSSRIRRFHHPYGWSYYDSYYTNSYMYDYNPNSWGTSIYLGYNWWAPSSFYYSPFTWSIGFNYGYPSYGYCNPYWSNYGYPSYGYGGGYWNGYNQGYMNGYYNGLNNGYYNPYYFNSYDNLSYGSGNNNYHYGPRRTSGGNHRDITPKSVSQLYTANVLKPETGGAITPPRSSTANNNSVSPVKNVMSPASSLNDVRNNDAIKNNPKDLENPGPRNNGQIKGNTNNYHSTPRTVKENPSNTDPKNNYQSEPRHIKDEATPKNNYNSDPRPKKNDQPKSEPRIKTDQPKSNNNYSAPSHSQPRTNNNSNSGTSNNNSGGGRRR